AFEALALGRDLSRQLCTCGDLLGPPPQFARQRRGGDRSPHLGQQRASVLPVADPFATAHLPTRSSLHSRRWSTGRCSSPVGWLTSSSFRRYRPRGIGRQPSRLRARGSTSFKTPSRSLSMRWEQLPRSSALSRRSGFSSSSRSPMSYRAFLLRCLTDVI